MGGGAVQTGQRGPMFPISSLLETLECFSAAHRELNKQRSSSSGETDGPPTPPGAGERKQGNLASELQAAGRGGLLQRTQEDAGRGRQRSSGNIQETPVSTFFSPSF